MGGQKSQELRDVESVNLLIILCCYVERRGWLSEIQTRILDFGLADSVLLYFLIQGAARYSEPLGGDLYTPAFFL
jgi:hypothetical protein